MKISKRILVRCISYAVAIVFAITGLIISTDKKIEDYKLQISNGYSMCLNELDGCFSNISVALQKAMYASTATQLSSIAVELSAEATVAKNSISQLPFSGQLTNVNKFLSQVGDYTYYLSKKVIQGDEISEKERENLHDMSKTAQKISGSVGVVRAEYDNEGVWDSVLTENINNSADSSLSLGFSGLEEMLSQSPSLIYDGPFSDHLLHGTIKMTENSEEISAEQAKSKAAEVLTVDVNSLTEATESDGKIVCYNFYNEELGVSVSKLGGYIVYMRKFRDVGEQSIEYEEAVEIAENYLNKASDGNFQSTYYFADEGICTVNLAHKEGATLCYPDLIKVGVALDTGEVVLLEAGGYIANHYTRTISTPKYSEERAKEVLSDKLEILSVKRVIIPNDGLSEKHCYEFNCRGIDEEELLIYINVDNLEEEKILLLLKTDGGVLTK